MVENKLRKEKRTKVEKDLTLIQEFDTINLKISSEELKNFETCIPELTIRPLAEKFPYNRNTAYNFVIYDIETNTSGKTAEICQLSAVDQSGLRCFNNYILSLRDVEIHATRVNDLSLNGLHRCCVISGEFNCISKSKSL